MSEPKPSTIKRLFALSRNVCAFPQCELPIVEDSGTVTGIVCHIKARSRGGPRFDSKQTDDERHSFNNLILLCSRHSKVIDSDPKQFGVELLLEIKKLHEQNGNIELSKSEATQAMKLLDSYRLIYIAPGSEVNIKNAETIHAKTVNVGGSSKAPKIQPPTGSIASSLAHRNYTKHLVDRYHEFASNQPGRTFTFPVIYANIKKMFGAKWDLIPLEKFPKLVAYLQGRIDNTRLGRINRSNEHPNYSTFGDYKAKHGYE